jgi:hypothetical protein
MPDADSTLRARPVPNGRIAAYVLIGCSALAVVALAMHPTAGAVRRPQDLAPAIVALTPIDEAVHAAMLAVVAAWLFALSVYALRRGITNGLVLAGLIGFGLGSLALTGAAVTDGFVVPAFGAHAARAGGDLHAVMAVFGLLGTAIAVFTKFGMVAISAGVLSWSVELVARGGRPRAAGIAGIVSALAVCGVLFSARSLHPHILVAMVVVQAVGYVWIARLLLSDAV